MSASNQPRRKKRTNKEVQKARIKNKIRLDNDVINKEVDEVDGLKKSRTDIQQSLAEMIGEVNRMHKYVNEGPANKLLTPDELNECNTVIKGFTEKLNSKKSVLKNNIDGLKTLENKVIKREDRLEEIVIEYNVGASSLMSDVFELTQAGADALITCNEQLENAVERDDINTIETTKENNDDRSE